MSQLGLLAEEVSDRIVDEEGILRIDPFLHPLLDKRQRFLEMNGRLTMFVLSSDQNMLFYHSDAPLKEGVWYLTEVLKQQKLSGELEIDRGQHLDYLIREVSDEEETQALVVMLYPSDDNAVLMKQMPLLAAFLFVSGILGWIVIYMLTRTLSRPIKQVVAASKQIVGGNYDLQLSMDMKEKELYELTRSFQEMSVRLKQVEWMRTELLAGVTHELKTPVASISGLIQAIRDGVVDEQETAEFYDICIKESQRLQKMIEDLLDFNSFVIGEINLCMEASDISELVRELSYQWSILPENQHLNVFVDDTELKNTDLIEIDSSRLQQILYNLFNNAKQAFHSPNGVITVRIYNSDSYVFVDVEDQGCGIPAEEQQYIFERFYRGTNKKSRVRGLGLGLTFSRMLARAMGGDLMLKQSSSEGTIFTLMLKKT